MRASKRSSIRAYNESVLGETEGKLRGRFSQYLHLLEIQLDVRVDPTIAPSESDLRAQLDVNLKLRDMQSSVNDALRTIDTVKADLDQAKGVPVPGLISERKQQLSSLELKLARPDNIPGYSMGPRLVDRLGQLLGSIDRVLAAPTPYQLEHFHELKAEFLRDIGDVNSFIERQVPEINEMLHKNSKTIEIPGSVK